MSYLCELKDGSNGQTGSGSNCLVLTVKLGQHIPSKKNHHFPSKDGKRILIDKEIKQRCKELEDAILSELCSLSRTIGGATPMGCWPPALTALLGLVDDSLEVIPEGSWGVRYVPKGEEGVEITITELTPGS